MNSSKSCLLRSLKHTGRLLCLGLQNTVNTLCTMSGFLRRAQRKLADLEARLGAARAEVARQIELDATRTAEKAARAAAQQAAKKAERAAYYAEHPHAVHTDAMIILLEIHLKRGLRFDPDSVDAFLVWKRETEFPPRTNLYQKAVQFIELNQKMTEPIPVFAKTMIGDLIPLEYHAERDAQDMLRQLETFDPEAYPLGTVSLGRMEENLGEPVEKSEMFFLFHNGATLVRYNGCAQYRGSDYVLDEFFDPNHSEAKIVYIFYVLPEGIQSYYPARYTESVQIDYYPTSQLIGNQYNRGRVPLSGMREFVRDLVVGYDHTQHNQPRPSTLTEQAQEELCAVFDAIRRDK